jgi:hypothetical protein
MKNNTNLAWYLTGFTDAEGFFNVTISPKQSGGYQVSLRFGLQLHEKDLPLLKILQEYFNGIGTIDVRKRKDSKNALAYWSVRKFDDIINVIIPHFNKYPLLTQKRADFLLFEKIALLMNNKEHLTNAGLHEIVAIKASMNLGLSEKLSISFPEITPYERPIVNILSIPDPNWIIGFTDGDGSFFVNIVKTNNLLGHKVKLMFRIAQHDRDLNLFNLIIKYLNCGTIQRKAYSGSQIHIIDFNVSKFNDIYTKIIPFFEEYKLKSNKNLDFLNFCEAAHLINDSLHLTPKGIAKILIIKAKMNSNR